MKDLLKDYIKKELKKLDTNGGSIELKNVYPDLLEDVLGEFVEPYELNGYDCDYWAKTDKYDVYGCMRFGTARISLLELDEEDEDENYQNEVKETVDVTEVENRVICGFKVENVPDIILNQLETFYFTFGYGQRHEGHYQPIMAYDFQTAHLKMLEMYGTKFASSYTQEKWDKESLKEYYPESKALETIVALG